MDVFDHFFRYLRIFVLSGILLAGTAAYSLADDSDGIDAYQQVSADLEIAAEADNGEDNFNDPIEPFNRFMFGFNEGLQDIVLRPFSSLYNKLPAGLRDAIGNAFDNIKTPVILANDLLQFQPERAAQTLSRFVVNSTLGIGGFVDVSEEMGGDPGHSEDFGQTLGAWGVGEGFYLVLPIFGPSNPRDAVGKLFVDGFFDPLSMYLNNTDREDIYWGVAVSGGMVEYAGVVDELDQIKSTSIDYYAAIRSMYRQKRKTEISNGTEVDLPPIPDLDLSYRKILDGDEEVSSVE